MMSYVSILPKLLRVLADGVESGDIVLDEPADGFYWTVFGRKMLDLDGVPSPTLGSFEELDETISAILNGQRPLGDVDLIRVGDLLKVVASTP